MAYDTSHPYPLPGGITWLAWMASIAALGASLGMSLYLKLNACPFCLYERIFVMGVVAIYTVGLLFHQRRGERLGLLALPLAIAALATIARHEYMEYSKLLECPKGYFGLGTTAQQAAVGLAIMTLFVLADAFRWMRGMSLVSGFVLVIGAGCLGVILSYAALQSSPPPQTPDYSKPFEMCRKPKPADNGQTH